MYYAQGNGAIEAFNKTLVAIISKMIKEKSTQWDDFLHLTPWAYQATKHTTIRESSFSLIYGAKAVWHAKISITSTRMLLEDVESSRKSNLELLEDHRATFHNQVQQYQKQVAQAYNKIVLAKAFWEGDLVLKIADHVMKGMSITKFTANWKGPYEIA